MEIIFAKTRYHYDPYIDLWRLVELSGFPTCYVDEIDFSRDTTYILSPLNGEYRPHRDNHRNESTARVISWCLERPGWPDGLGEYTASQRQLIDSGYFSEVWLSDQWLAGQCDDSRVRFVPLGSHSGLIQSPRKPPRFEYDVAHISYEFGRRNTILGNLRDLGFKVMPSCWPPERDVLLGHTATLLNIHQDGWPIIEPLRFAIAASARIPVISEAIHDAEPYSRGGPRHYIIQAGYDDLVPTMKKLARGAYEPLQAMASRAHDLMCHQYEFGRVVRAAARGETVSLSQLVLS